MNTKFEELVHYILWYCKDKQYDISEIKLDKILWLLDVHQYCLSGHSLSGEEYYIKEQYGPVPPHILAVLNNLGVLTTGENTPQKRIDIKTAVINKPDKLEELDQKELERVRQCCDEWAEVSAKTLSDYSHDNVYDSYKLKEQIPLAAYLVSEPIAATKQDIAWARKSLAL
jgi:hypothetical protein